MSGRDDHGRSRPLWPTAGTRCELYDAAGVAAPAGTWSLRWRADGAAVLSLPGGVPTSAAAVTLLADDASDWGYHRVPVAWEG